MKFEWDERKAAANITKHGVTFEAATAVFDDPHAMTDLDADTIDEDRWQIIGLTQGGVLFVVFTERNGNVVRIISARKATRHEQDRYYRQAFS